MLRIESGSTLDQRIRTGIFFLMFAGFSGWFGYDGMIGYPAKNLREWSGLKLPHRPADLDPNPRATKHALEQIEAGRPVQEVRDLLGEPSIEQHRRLTFVGSEVTVSVDVGDDDKVSAVRIAPTEKNTPEKDIGILVTRARAELVKEGLAESGVRQMLGEPASVQAHTLWYIGPATFGEFRIAEGKVAPNPIAIENEHRSEGDILLQKVIAAATAIVAIYGLLRFLGAMRMRVAVDDAGLTFNGRVIPWDSMLRLKTDQYQDKAWVDLEYRDGASERMLRLDALIIQRFKEIMAVVCEKKGYTLPARSSEQAAVDDPDMP